MSKQKLAIVVAAIAIVTSACGNPDTTVGGDPPAPAITQGPSAAPGLAVAESDVGAIVVDGEGRTLYLFTSDAGGVSTCSGQCAETWPPFTDDLVGEAGPGVDNSLIGTIVRDDGAVQVTYNGHPIYYFKGDRAPGDINGHGFRGEWFAFTGTGVAVEEVIIPSYEY